MPGLNCVCVPEESEADTRREYGHESFPNDGHRDGAGSDSRLRLLIRSGPVQAVPTSCWLKSDPREEAKLWRKEWTAVHRHWTKILLGHETVCPGAPMCVLGMENLPSVKDVPIPRQTD